MREFRDIPAFLAFLRTLPTQVAAGGQVGLTTAARLIQHEAKEEIGHYQGQEGSRPGWAQLSDATLYGFRHPLAGWIEGKIAAGYATEAEHRPLERTGAMRDSIEVTVDPGRAVIGSGDMILVYQEMGTPDALYPIPPRPVLGSAAFRMEHTALNLMAGNAFLSLAGVPIGGPRQLLLQETRW